MRKISILLALLFSVVVQAQTPDSIPVVSPEVSELKVLVSKLQADLDQVTKTNESMDAQIKMLLDEKNKLTQRINSLENKYNALLSSVNDGDAKREQLAKNVMLNSEDIKNSKLELDKRISNTTATIETQTQTIKKNSLLGYLIAALVLIISAVLTVILHKKGDNKIAKLNEEVVNKFAIEIAEMQKISSSIGTLSTAGASSDDEQALIKTLADRITFMEMTLYKMDSSVRGHKHLTRSIAQMKDNLLANGYEIVDMLGKEYHDGMKVSASFVEDESIEAGKQIITGITKPQINYNGKMIQPALIQVSQNI